MSPIEETRADYAATEMTTGPHMLAHLREPLRRRGVVSAAELLQHADGERVTAAGAVIVRQRPGTAKGFVFLTLEDETGMLQAIVRPLQHNAAEGRHADSAGKKHCRHCRILVQG